MKRKKLGALEFKIQTLAYIVGPTFYLHPPLFLLLRSPEVPRFISLQYKPLFWGRGDGEMKGEGREREGRGRGNNPAHWSTEGDMKTALHIILTCPLFPFLPRFCNFRSVLSFLGGSCGFFLVCLSPGLEFLMNPAHLCHLSLPYILQYFKKFVEIPCLFLSSLHFLCNADFLTTKIFL